jgi:penicillin-binding protein 1A
MNEKWQKSVKVLSRLLWVAFALTVLGAGVAVAGYYYLAQDLPPLTSIHNYRPAIITSVYADDGTLISQFAEERRILVPANEIPASVVKAFLATEDHRFLDHQGVDWYSVARTIITNLESGEIRGAGASTITMQVARTFFLSREKTFTRKLKEAIMAVRIEKGFSKPEILFLYLSQVDLGRGCYGVGAASEYYFGKPAQELSLGEAALLAGILPAPSRLNPVTDFDAAKTKQLHVLNRMALPEVGFITPEEADAIYKEPIKIIGDIGPRGEAAPYFTEQVRRILIERYGRDVVYKEGLQVFTTVNLKADSAARQSVRDLIIGPGGVDRNLGFRRDKVRHLSAEAAGELLQKQEDQLRRAWLSRKWDELLAQGGAGDRSYDQLKAKVPDPAPLEPGKTYNGVVTKVDDASLTVSVKIGHSRGLIDKKGMGWVHDYLEKNEQGEVKDYKFTKPSQILAPNDQVQVKVMERGEDEKGAVTYALSLEQDPVIEGALFSMAVRTGHVKALCGGLDYNRSQFIRATQSRRQPGSSFKPIIYSAALDAEPRGRFTAATIVVDAPIVFQPGMKNRAHPEDPAIYERYTPKNYDGTFNGEMTLRDAVAFSRNTVAVKVAWDLGLANAVEFAHKLGIKSHLDVLPCVALGCSEVPLDELSAAYNDFASGGYHIEPVYITRVYDRDGNLLEYEKRVPLEGLDQLPDTSQDYGDTTSAGDTTTASAAGDSIGLLSSGLIEEDIGDEGIAPDQKVGHYYLSRPTPPQQLGELSWDQYLARIRANQEWLEPANYPAPHEADRVISPQTAFIINDLLRSVVRYGTATRANALNKPVAGKTGTTNNYRDAWFVGYTPELLAGVWVGPDDFAYSLGRGESGSKVALPIWVAYMQKMLADRSPVNFPVPRDIVWVKIDKSDGLRFSDCSLPEDRRVDPFIKGTAPKDLHPCEASATPGRSFESLKSLDMIAPHDPQ